MWGKIEIHKHEELIFYQMWYNDIFCCQIKKIYRDRGEIVYNNVIFSDRLLIELIFCLSSTVKPELNHSWEEQLFVTNDFFWQG